MNIEDPTSFLFLQKHADAGGSKQSLLTALRALQEAGQRPLVLCAERGPFTELCAQADIKLAFAPFPAWRKWTDRLRFGRHVARMRAALPRLDFDAVIANEMWWAPHARLLATEADAVSAALIRDTLAIGPKASQYQLHRLDRVLCVSDAIRQGLAHHIPSAALRTLYNPIQTPAPSSNAAAFTWPGRDRATRWLACVGKVDERKNQIDAVRTLHHLRAQTGVEWGLVLAGDADADYLKSLKQEAASLGLEHLIVHLGHVACVGDLLHAVDALVLTSQREGLPRSIIEALLANGAAFTWPLPGVAEIFQQHTSLFVPDQPTPEALARTIANAFNHPSLDAPLQQLRQQLHQRHDPANYPGQLCDALVSRPPQTPDPRKNT